MVFSEAIGQDNRIHNQVETALKTSNADLNFLKGLVLENQKLKMDTEEIKVKHVVGILENVRNKPREKIYETWKGAGVTFAVQYALNEMNYEPGTIDGVLWTKTKAAVKKFQEDWNSQHPDDQLTADGLAGGSTIDRMLQVSARKFTANTSEVENQPDANEQLSSSEALKLSVEEWVKNVPIAKFYSLEQQYINAQRPVSNGILDFKPSKDDSVGMEVVNDTLKINYIKNNTDVVLWTITLDKISKDNKFDMEKFVVAIRESFLDRMSKTWKVTILTQNIDKVSKLFDALSLITSFDQRKTKTAEIVKDARALITDIKAFNALAGTIKLEDAKLVELVNKTNYIEAKQSCDILLKNYTDRAKSTHTEQEIALKQEALGKLMKEFENGKYKSSFVNFNKSAEYDTYMASFKEIAKTIFLLDDSR